MVNYLDLDAIEELDDLDITAGTVFEYLVDLRDSGVTNMFGAATYIEVEFGTSRNTSHKLLSLWMNSFKDGHSDD